MSNREYRTIVKPRTDGDYDVMACFIWDIDEVSASLDQFEAMVETVRRWYSEDETDVLIRQDIPDVVSEIGQVNG